jgi:cbb3-type cytochrome oxidase subunit 3
MSEDSYAVHPDPRKFTKRGFIGSLLSLLVSAVAYAVVDTFSSLWIFVLAVISLALVLVAWSRQRKAESLEERSKIEVT